MSKARGEIRHEQCRFGVFAEQAFHIDERGRETPFAMPLCAWKPPSDAPPLLARVWSGAIDFERDCATCPVFRTVDAADPNKELLEQLSGGIVYKTDKRGRESNKIDLLATEKLFCRAFVAMKKLTEPPSTDGAPS